MLSASLEPQFLTLNLITIVTWLETIHLIIRLGPNHQWRQHWDEWFCIDTKASLFGDLFDHRWVRERCDHKLDNRLLQQHQIPHDISKASASNLGGSFFVEPAFCLGNFVVIFRHKIKGWNITDDLYLNVLILTQTNWHVGVRHIRHLL